MLEIISRLKRDLKSTRKPTKLFKNYNFSAHPNVKVFITHGGLIGMQEAIYNGVPIIGVPIFSDQYNNVLLAEQTGVGKMMQYKDINQETLNKTLNEVLNNDFYLKKARELQRRWKDRPMSPLNTTIFWLEYVIRHKGAVFIKNPARNMTWVAYTMTDVYIFIFAVIIGAITFFVKLKVILTGLISKVFGPKLKKVGVRKKIL